MILDRGLALVLLAIISPLLLLTAILLRFTAEGEVFYKQQRLGLGNKSFGVWKFATMLKDSPSIGAGTITTKDDPRVTSVGSFLRKTKINELPQVFNIINGSMSFVGPRPLPKSDFDDYSQDVQKTIYSVLPGLTGIGSVIFRDEEQYFSGSTPAEIRSINKNRIAPLKGAVELWYVANQSFIVDFKILVATVLVVLNSRTRIYLKLFPEIRTMVEASEL